MAIAAGTFTSCVNDDDYNVPDLECIESTLVANKTVQEIYNNATDAAVLYEGDDVIEAVVVSSDQGGNFYKTMFLTSLDGNIGFSLQINDTDLFTNYNVGRKVFIKLTGLYTQIRSNTLQIGALYNGNIGQIPTLTYGDNIERSCTVIAEEELVNVITDLSTLDDSYIGKLIEFQGVQFTDASLGQTYYNESNVDGGGQTLTYITSSDAETITVPFRTGSFTEYGGTEVSANSGTIRGILTKFNTTYQFVSRYETDINLTEDRDGDTGGSGSGDGTAKGGTDIVFGNPVSEDFESYDAGNHDGAFPKYVNDHSIGDRYWELREFGGNQYIQMSSFNGSGNPGEPAKAYFFVPADFAAPTFTFDKQMRYMSGEALKVYYVTENNYTVGEAFDVANFVDITAEFADLTYPANGESQNSFTSAGTYNIPASVTGNGFFVFEYTGTETITTTVQIDNILVGEGGSTGGGDSFFNEDFSDAVDNTDFDLPGWYSIIESGNRTWSEQAFSGNGYAEFSSFGSGDDLNVAWLVTPAMDLDTNTNASLQFETAQHHLDGDTDGNKIEIFVVTSFDGTDIVGATKVDITSQVSLPTTANSWYEFVNSGSIDLSSYSGNVYIAFKYTGSGTDETNDGAFQIDNVVLSSN
ncbi:MAG: hypothetical protein BM557_06655 [Flavobacterium sp. MedPE-SWcel]|nr:MAG: hypothetical protein BM557_06655 [Flavobacterium sp. MedPE-SWcel]